MEPTTPWQPRDTPNSRLPSAWEGGGNTPDLLSADLQKRTTLIVLASLLGVGAGVFSLLVAGPQGTLTWLGFLVAAVALLFLLLRYYELGIVAFLGVCWIAIGTPTLAQGGSGGGAQTLKLSHIGLLALLAVWGIRLFFRKPGVPALYKSPVNKAVLVYLCICLWSTVNGILFYNAQVAASSPKQYIQVNLLENLTRILALGGMLLLANNLQGRPLKAAAVAVVLPGIITFTGLVPFIPASFFLAFPQILAMAVLAALALTGDEWRMRLWLRVLCGVVALSILGVYFLKGTEWVSGWSGALITLGLITFTARRKLFYITIAVVALIIVVNFGYFYNTVYKSNFYGSGPTHDRNRAGQMGTFTNDRSRMLGAAVRYANTFPLGVGLGNYRAYNKYFGRIDVWNTTTFTSAHGTFAQALSETGWLGLFSLLWLLFATARMLRRYWIALPPGWGRSYVLGAYGGCVGVFCASFLGDYLFPSYHNGGMGSFGACVYTWLIAGVGVAVAREHGLDWAEITGRVPASLAARNAAPLYLHGPYAGLPAAGLEGATAATATTAPPPRFQFDLSGATLPRKRPARKARPVQPASPVQPEMFADPTGRCDLSVVIVSWNTRALLKDCLDSLFTGGGLEGVVGAEVWVVDNASSDNSAGMVREMYPGVQVIENRENVGFARANNQALRKARGRYLLLLNSDTVVPRGALRDLVRVMNDQPNASVASPLLLNADGSPQWCWARFPGLTSELSGTLDRSQSPYPLDDFADLDRRRGMAPFVADWVGGACFLVRASAVTSVGLLDENFFMYSEETDWCRRFYSRGGNTLLIPSVTVTHLGGGSARAVPLATRKRVYQSSVRFYQLSYGPIGGFLPSAVAYSRYVLFHVKVALRGAGNKG